MTEEEIIEAYNQLMQNKELERQIKVLEDGIAHIEYAKGCLFYSVNIHPARISVVDMGVDGNHPCGCEEYEIPVTYEDAISFLKNKLENLKSQINKKETN